MPDFSTSIRTSSLGIFPTMAWVARHQRMFVQFLSRHELGKECACVCHNDVDGASSAVLLHHCLADRNPLHIIATQKAETAWSPASGKKSVCLPHLSNIHTFVEFKRTYVDYPVQLLQRCVSLLNAPRRTGTGNAEPAVRLLLRARNPRELLDAKDADVRLLMTARTEINSELASAKRSRPRFSGPVALICVHSACQLHPLIAQIWRMRLPEYIVITANFGYREGYVHFSVRSATRRKLIDFLRKYTPTGSGENFARGHDSATGGSILADSWYEFARALGLSREEARWRGAI